MHLNDPERKVLSGESGKASALAMNILYDLGRLYGAKKMIPVSQVHIDITLYMVDAGVEFAEKMAQWGWKFAVPTQLNPASIDLLHHERMHCNIRKKAGILHVPCPIPQSMPTIVFPKQASM